MRPVWSAVISDGNSLEYSGTAVWNLDHANLVIVLRYGFKGHVPAVRRPAGSSSRSVQSGQLRAIGSVIVAHPNIRVTHAVRLEDDFLAVGRIAGPPRNSPSGEEPYGSSHGVAPILQVEPPNGLPLLPDRISELVPPTGDRRVAGILSHAGDALRRTAGGGNAPETWTPFHAGSEDDLTPVLSPGGIASGISGSQAQCLAAGNFHHKQVTHRRSHWSACERDGGAVGGEDGVAIKLFRTRKSERVSSHVR